MLNIRQTALIITYSHPEPFECSITPRSPEVIDLVHHAIRDEE
jgi:hypothetical protein